jgi:hypothetical protein
MALVIRRYLLSAVHGPFEIMAPAERRILSAGQRLGSPCLWVAVNSMAGAAESPIVGMVAFPEREIDLTLVARSTCYGAVIMDDSWRTCFVFVRN